MRTWSTSRDYKVDKHRARRSKSNLNAGHQRRLSAKPGGGVLFFPKGIYKTGTIVMRRATSSCTWTRTPWFSAKSPLKAADYAPRRAFVVFNDCETPALAARGSFDNARLSGLVARLPARHRGRQGQGSWREKVVPIPHITGIRGHVVNNCRTFPLTTPRLRIAYHDFPVSG